MRKAMREAGLFSLFLGIAFCCFAQENNTAREADHKALRALKDKIVMALNTRDIGALSSCLAKKYALITVDQQVLTSEAQIREYFKKTFESPTSLVTAVKLQADADILTQFIGENAGYCYGSTTEAYTMRDGRMVPMKNRWSAALVKEDGEWKVAILHGAANFLDNALLAKVRSQLWKFLFVGLLGGALIGLCGGLLIGKARGRKVA